MSRAVLHGSVDQSTVLRFVDSADGTPETSVDHSTSGLALWYRREGGLKVAITPAALAALDTAHTDGGVEQIGDGYVRVDVPDLAFASGAVGVMIGGSATGMVCIGHYHPLRAVNDQDAAGFGLSRLDAAVTTRLASADYTTPPTAAANADAVWDEATSGHTTSGTFGEQVKTDIDSILALVGTTGVVVASGSKTGYALAATGLDSISASDPATTSPTFAQMVVMLYRRFFKKTTLDSSGNYKTYGDDGSTVRTTEVITDSSGTQTKGAAS